MKNKIIILSLCALLLIPSALAENSVLSVFGKEGAGDFENEYLKQSDPDIEWIGIDVAGNNGAKDMAFQMQTNHDCFDMYSVGYSYCGFEELRDKGFSLDLTPYPDLVEIVGKMYPYLQEAVYSDGKLYAIPMNVSASGWGYSPAVFDAMGLGADAVPKTYQELLDLLKWWIEEGEQYPDYYPFIGFENSRGYLVNQVIHDYVNYCTLQGIHIDFESSVIADILVSIDELDTNELDRRNAQAAAGGSYSADTLFFPDLNYSNISDVYAQEYQPLHLRFEDKDAFFPTDIQIFAINPYSKNVDLAIKYIVTFLKGVGIDREIALFDDPSAQPVESPSYETELADCQKRMATLDAASDQGDPQILENRIQLQSEMDAIQAGRWLITAEQIANYQELTESLRVRRQNVLERNSTNGTLEIYGLTQQFIARAISVEQFTKEANRVLKTILLEDQ